MDALIPQPSGAVPSSLRAAGPSKAGTAKHEETTYMAGRLALRWAGFVSLLLTALACGSASPVAQEAKVAPRPVSDPAARIQLHPALAARAYTDRLGTVLEFVPVRVKGSSDVHAIVRVTGVGGPIEGVPFLATRGDAKHREQWAVPLLGHEVTIVSNVLESVERDTLVLTVPKRDRRVHVTFDSAATQTIVATELVASHSQAQASGQLGRLARYDRDERSKRMQESIDKEAGKLAADCQSEITVTVDWDSFDDSALTSQDYCFRSVRSLALLCRTSENGRENLVEKVKQVSCAESRAKSAYTVSNSRVLAIHAPHARELDMTATTTRLSEVLELGPIVLKSRQGIHLWISPWQPGVPEVHAGRLPNLHRQRISSGNSKNVLALWHAGVDVTVSRAKGRRWRASCSKGLEFTEVSREERKSALTKVKMQKRIWRREPVMLGRDGRGTYHYVDSLTSEEGGYGHRWFRGPRGAAKQVKVIDVVTDPTGFILVSESDRLEVRGISSKDIESATLIASKRSEKLRQLTLLNSSNREFVYTNLGAYNGETFGGICELSRTVPKR